MSTQVYVGGDMIEITCNHPTLGSFNFSTKSNESYTVDPGGIRSNDDANSVTGAGIYLDQMNRVRWSFEGPLMVDFKNDTERDALTKLTKSAELGTWTFSHISGAIWRGKGKPVGDITFDTNNAQMTSKIAGGGELTLN